MNIKNITVTIVILVVLGFIISYIMKASPNSGEVYDYQSQEITFEQESDIYGSLDVEINNFTEEELEIDMALDDLESLSF